MKRRAFRTRVAGELADGVARAQAAIDDRRAEAKLASLAAFRD